MPPDQAQRRFRIGWIFAILALLCASLPARALQTRSIRFDRISIEQGLSQSAVNSIYQDRHGIMWFGTEDGLNRFDGYEFRIYKRDPRDVQSLPRAYVWTIFEDRDGRLWIGTDGGLVLWNPAKQTFERFDSAGPKLDLSASARAVAQDADGVLWIGTDDGLIRFDYDAREMRLFAHEAENSDSLSNNKIRALLVDSSNRLWVGTLGGGLDRYDPATESFIHHREVSEDPLSLSDNKINAIFQDRLSRIWIGTDRGLNRVINNGQEFARYLADPEDLRSLPHDAITSITEDPSGTLWIGTEKGLSEFLNETETFVTYVNRGTDPRSLSDDHVNSLFVDRGGVLWVGTKTRGLNKWNAAANAFRHVQRDPEDPESLSSNTVTTFQEDQRGNLYVGTFGGGLNVVDAKSGSIRHMRQDNSGLNDDRVMSLRVDEDGILWIGTFRGGLNRYDPETDTFQEFKNRPGDPTSLSGDGVMAIYEDRQHDLWVGLFGNGLARMKRGEGTTFERFAPDPSQPGSLSGDRITAFCEDARDNLWIGTDGGGINRFDRATGTFEVVRARPQNPDGLSADDILSLYVDPSDTLWIGTQDAGLQRWRAEDRYAKREVFRTYTENDGLPNNQIYGILRDEGGFLWLSTNDGLSRFDPTTETFTNYDTRRGLQSNEFNFGAYLRGRDGSLYFGGINGYNVIQPGETLENPYIPPVVLTKLFRAGAGDEAELGTAVTDLKRIVLTHDDDVVWFEFAALDYTAPVSNHYAYKLEGFDSDWIDLGNIRRATFTNLDAGTYTLRVRGSNNDRVWNENGLAIEIQVLPPPWKTWWAYTGYGLMILGIGIGAWRTQARKLREEEEHSRQLELEVQSRTRELESRNDELRVLNSRLEEASLTDPLTGLRNRRYLVTRIRDDIVRSEMERGDDRRERPDPGTPEFSFLMVDMDGLKGINDQYGHQTGDKAILQICGLLQAICRESDTIIRWGGDEFMIVARNLNPIDAEALAERIRLVVSGERVALSDGMDATLSCSVGLAHYPFLPEEPSRVSWEQVIAIADRALYIAKTSGRNAWASITGTEATKADGLLDKIYDETESLVNNGAIRFNTSIGDRTRLVWSRK